MHTENLSEAFSRCLELLDQPAAAPPRAEFAADFAAALQRLEASGGEGVPLATLRRRFTAVIGQH
jgi:hypothetical protein